ncbi:hypothetical protein SAMN04515671_2942 [Nakamurella panacisegetis]|uniref:Uncharacterized protein n=1 Tax=Nakamurella panacisegetis TaxID=1090615 RepID=A0A1H0Q0Z4_9ACTN|nr:hypothetical protein [Nakamurella panacisegetis]SDP10348.1 hypothetical protein SAMN04515671_2942 [Nakamurella panacisegetis]
MMPSEAAKLLGVCAAFDMRTVGEADSKVWAAALGDLDLGEASNAVVAHYSTTTERIMPASLMAAVKANRRRIIAAAGEPPFPPGLPYQAEQRYRRAWHARLMNGHPPAAARALADRDLGITRRTAPEIPAPQQVRLALERFTRARKVTR